MSYLTVQINGGAGKTVMFSAVIKNLKETYSSHKIISVTNFPELLLNNPNIFRCYKTGVTPYFYEDFVVNDGDIISSLDPYGDSQYLKGENHLISIWSRLLGATEQFKNPEIFITKREFDHFYNKNFQEFGKANKPLLVINPFGGAQKDVPYSWNRDIPPNQAQELVDVLSQKYLVVQVGREDQIKLKNCLHFSSSLRGVCCLLKLAKKRILIDSFCQHASAALNLPSTVVWITNKSKVFGYNIHKNILAKDPENFIHKIDSFAQEQNFIGTWNHYYPYNDSNVFNISEIVDS